MDARRCRESPCLPTEAAHRACDGGQRVAGQDVDPVNLHLRQRMG